MRTRANRRFAQRSPGRSTSWNPPSSGSSPRSRCSPAGARSTRPRRSVELTPTRCSLSSTRASCGGGPRSSGRATGCSRPFATSPSSSSRGCRHVSSCRSATPRRSPRWRGEQIRSFGAGRTSRSGAIGSPRTSTTSAPRSASVSTMPRRSPRGSSGTWDSSSGSGAASPRRRSCGSTKASPIDRSLRQPGGPRA